MQKDALVFDFVIVGAGSAGCVLAGNLSASGKHSVLLLEAGPDINNFWIKTPLGYGHSIQNSAVNWMYSSAPEPTLAGRTLAVPRGKVVGGSSAINAMVYMRGTRADYDEWAGEGNPDWTWDKVLTSYKRLENHCIADDEWHGTCGPLEVTSRAEVSHPVCKTFLEAAEQLQLGSNNDFNGASIEGVGYYHHTIGRNKKRMSAARAWLSPARKRKNFRLLANAQVTRIELTGKKATGIIFRHNGKTLKAKANREIILSAGAINTPQLLMVSGIGPGLDLERARIGVKHVLPAVGQHMQDHFAYDHYYRSRVPTMNQQLGGLWQKFRAGMAYVFKGQGPLSTGTTHAGGFVKSSQAYQNPNIQLYFSPLSRDEKPGKPGEMGQVDSYAAFGVSICNVRPRSRGYVKVRTDDILDAPEIRFNFLSNDQDMVEMLEGARLLRRLAATPAMSSIIEREYIPGQLIESDEAFEADIRARGYSIYHPCGTCRMGSASNTSVVSSRLKVHGIDGLRIADASVMPFVVSGNLNGPSMMIGQRASEIILEDAAA